MTKAQSLKDILAAPFNIKAGLTDEQAAALLRTGVGTSGSQPPCLTCNGSGWLSGRAPSPSRPWERPIQRCPCQTEPDRETRQRALSHWSELPPALQKMTFESLALKPELRDAMLACHAYAKGELSERWLALSGPNGTGKTHLGAAVLNWRNEHAEDGKAFGKYANVPDKLADLKDGFRDDTAEQRFNRYRDVALLVLDDVGAENATAWAREQLFRLIEHRSVNLMETVITTNLKPTALPPRLADRLLASHTGLVKVIEVRGESWRSGIRWPW